jgi:hypothetical protein
VKAQPGYDWERQQWNTEVAELGIACGSCHGPAGAHAQRALVPWTRYLWHWGAPQAPPTGVVHPAKLDSDRSMQICAHCHGQRVPEPEERIREICELVHDAGGQVYVDGANLLVEAQLFCKSTVVPLRALAEFLEVEHLSVLSSLQAGRPPGKSAEVLVSGAEAWVVRDREDPRDLFAGSRQLTVLGDSPAARAAARAEAWR